jgi:hypothetical protein
MGDETEPLRVEKPLPSGISHSRLLAAMAAIGFLGSLAGTIFASAAFGFGVLLGTTLALINYFWLRRSLERMFAAAIVGEMPALLGLRYFLRYVLLGAVVAIVYATGIVPVASVILGLGTFAFAVVAEGVFRIFSDSSGAKEA